MVARLLGFALFYALTLCIPVLVFHERLSEWWTARRARLHGIRNARALAAWDGQTCFYCLQPCTEHDCFDKKVNRWYHASCMKALLG